MKKVLSLASLLGIIFIVNGYKPLSEENSIADNEENTIAVDRAGISSPLLYYHT